MGHGTFTPSAVERAQKTPRNQVIMAQDDALRKRAAGDPGG
jgi:hypothetical protein